MKKVFYTLIIIVVSISLCGCWGYMDVNELNILYGVGFDINKDNKYTMITEGISPVQTKKDIEYNTNTFYSSAIGKSAFDAARNLTRNASGKRSYYQTCQTVVLGKNLCETSITPIIDFFTRDPKRRRGTVYFAMFEGSISELFLKNDKLQGPISLEIKDIINLYQYTGYAVDMKLYKTVANSKNISNTLILNKFKIEHLGNNIDNLKLVLDGTGIFYDNKLVGYFDLQETMVANIMYQQISETPIVLNTNSNEHGSITVELSKFKTKFNPVVNGNKYIMNVEISANAAMVEYSENQTLKGYDYKKLEELTSEYLKKVINATFFKCKNELKVDALDFGERFARKYKNISKMNPEEWKKIFCSDVDLNLKIKTNVVTTGTTTEKSD